MSIVVKGSNDVLVFHCTVKNDFNNLLKEIDELLDKPLFLQEGYYPKAFFDFDCRYLTEDELERLLKVLFVKKRVLFCGVNLKEKEQKTVDIYGSSIHAGEVVHVEKETLFLLGVNRGGTIYCYQNIYFLGSVRGKIISFNQNIKIYGHHFENAQIQIMNHTLHDVTTLANVMIYDNKEKIVIQKEEELWQELL